MNSFAAKLSTMWPGRFLSEAVETIQVNIGRNCNLACRHCHLECSPDRTEMMSWDAMEKIIATVQESSYRLVDVTGGSPERHPLFRRFLAALRKADQPVQVRTNLVSLIEPEGEDTGAFLRDHGITLVGSLPCYLEENVRGQRGPGVYEKSIAAIRALNRLGYGRDETLVLNLVHNPTGPFLPGGQADLEKDYRSELKKRFGVSFNNLFVLANVPIGRFKKELERSGKADVYARRLEDHFNPANLPGLMCRHQISVDWDGRLYDCDFNLALGISVNHGVPNHIDEFDRRRLDRREIITGNHCFACTAGQGSSCMGCLQEPPGQGSS